MSNNIVTLLLGTNLGDKNSNLEIARSLITSEIGEIIKFSNILENDAEGFTTSNSFLNQKIEVSTEFSPIEMLNIVKKIEYSMGRIYEKPKEGELYIDRIIDIDILRYNNIYFFSDILTIPHNQIYTRDFIKDLSFI
ncbi:2-amino-4-hydroxy-6-hydroxymethyldihydropteridine diphosphokinase [Faecalibacter sp. WQ 117]|uniref:2-amino-4-hydroxy-6-hydroxymethyldihydropteridine pyrophosphokinase n=1 Tax=Faecalibacter rhinopitheci TaxID=2779678 RepID=A0A8J7K3S1_9FLAO|nr:2-amino-4-hydroxy-6-hydroxymethyldihydropteridine diphosphokinase [Faecalibacter rhinopitheci]